MIKTIAIDVAKNIVVCEIDYDTYNSISRQVAEFAYMKKHLDRRKQEVKTLQAKLAKRKVQMKEMLSLINNDEGNAENAMLKAQIEKYEDTIEERDNQISLLYAAIARLKGDEAENNGN